MFWKNHLNVKLGFFLVPVFEIIFNNCFLKCREHNFGHYSFLFLKLKITRKIYVRLLYMIIIYFPFLGLYSQTYIRHHLVYVIYNFLIYKD